MSHFTVAVFSHYEDEVDELLAPYEEGVDRDSDYADFVEDEEYDVDPTTGKRGYWANPNAKWDWYSIGGRWSGELKLKSGESVDSARVRDCVFERDDDIMLQQATV